VNPETNRIVDVEYCAERSICRMYFTHFSQS
jgi:hypothetical protein